MGLINKFLKNKKFGAVAKEKKAEVAVEKKEDNKGKEKEVKFKNKLKINLDGNSVRVLVSPLVTEKAAIAESTNKYSFKVSKWATKSQIKMAVKELYGILPIRVSTINVDGKKVNFKRSGGKKKDYKKAVVTLPVGKTIDIHKGV